MSKIHFSTFFKGTKVVSEHTIAKVHRFSKDMCKDYLSKIKALAPKAEIGEYIEDHCRIYNDDGPDDPSLTPQGEHISYPVKDLKTFKKYFKIVPRSEIGIVTKRKVDKHADDLD